MQDKGNIVLNAVKRYFIFQLFLHIDRIIICHTTHVLALVYQDYLSYRVAWQDTPVTVFFKTLPIPHSPPTLPPSENKIQGGPQVKFFTFFKSDMKWKIHIRFSYIYCIVISIPSYILIKNETGRGRGGELDLHVVLILGQTKKILLP